MSLMSMNGDGGPPPGIDLDFIREDRDAAAVLIPMGITSENVAAKFGVRREEQDAFSVQSHAKAHRAQENGLFEEEILPVRVRVSVVFVVMALPGAIGAVWRGGDRAIQLAAFAPRLD